MKNLMLGLFLIFMALSCIREHNKIDYAVYHWTSNLDISDKINNRLDSLNISKMYVRFADIDWSDETYEPIPKAKLTVQNILNDSMEIIPTIFITNRTFLKIKSHDLKGLVNNIYHEILRTQNLLPNPIKEIQFDCDWSGKSKVKYFEFLSLFKKSLIEKKISCTIRLHQVKYFEKTGVPPVDKGMLMYYNMSAVDEIKTKNSIIDNEIGQAYLNRLRDYPLKLDVVLPSFSWGAIFRDGKLIRLITDLVERDLNSIKFIKVSKNQYKVLKSTFLYGVYLYEDDIVKLEVVSKSNLLESARLLKTKLSNESRTISLYHLDSKVFSQYEITFLQKIYDIFSDPN